ncbi:hypothetical protein GTA08_BOTSDO12954 [Botryosphaeria dothidea]|uniref:Uncharacterized protein n=1 Tax=Botryosphaeria dothidea TaxID=55169 RepID=A0A8H4J3I8_9PEZI|nr:hypothetical protein GTA08_BOTSDO12954 [Botryosphaeria dothidea]
MSSILQQGTPLGPPLAQPGLTQMSEDQLDRSRPDVVASQIIPTYYHFGGRRRGSGGVGSPFNQMPSRPGALRGCPVTPALQLSQRLSPAAVSLRGLFRPPLTPIPASTAASEVPLKMVSYCSDLMREL